MFKLKDGINVCTNNEYHGDKNYFSSSALKLLVKNPSDFYDQYVLGNRENIQRAAFDEGTYAHSLILEPDMVQEEFAFYPGLRKAGKLWEEFKKNSEGRIILSKPQKIRIDRLFDVYNNHKVAKDFIKGGFSEHTVAGSLEGVPIKVRADYINPEAGYIADVKTTAYGTDVDTFKHTIDQFCYQLSAALYTKMFSNYYGKDLDFYFIVLGKKDYTCDVFKTSKETMEQGYDLVRQALSTYKKCKKTGIWENKRKTIKITSDEDYNILEV